MCGFDFRILATMPMTPFERLKNQQNKAELLEKQTRFAESRPLFRKTLAEALTLLEPKPRKKKDGKRE